MILHLIFFAVYFSGGLGGCIGVWLYIETCRLTITVIKMMAGGTIQDSLDVSSLPAVLDL